jgi:hypothetical protein
MAGAASDDLATTTLLADDADVVFHPDAAGVLIDAIPIIARARVEDFYFERDVARRMCKEWEPADTLDIVRRFPPLGLRGETSRKAPKPGRNDPCSCGSGRKYKKCCGG